MAATQSSGRTRAWSARGAGSIPAGAASLLLNFAKIEENREFSRFSENRENFANFLDFVFESGAGLRI